MAVSVNEIESEDSRIKFFQIVKTADGDDTAVIDHNLPFAPEKIYFKPLGVKFYTLQTPIISTVTSSSVTILMGTGAGSGDPDAQFEVILEAPHSVTD